METDYFRNIIKEQYTNEGNSMYYNNEKYITENLGIKDLIIETNISNFYRGSFYFVYYDLTSKISKMEKINPILLIDYFDMNNTRTYYVLNINFLPIAIRVLFFNNILNYNLDIIENNNNTDILSQKPIPNIKFITIYKMLKKIGFEWAIRKLDINKINKIYKVSTSILDKFITMSTHTFTGVGDNKLIDIWKSKIEKQDEREKTLINNLINDFDNMNNNFKTMYKDLNSKTENLEESLKIIRNF